MTVSNDAIESLYALAESANQRVNTTHDAYLKATRERAESLRRLQDLGGQSLYAISKRLGLSTARIAQIIARAKAQDVTTDGAAPEATDD